MATQPSIPQQNIRVNHQIHGCVRYTLGYCDCLTDCDLIRHPEHFKLQPAGLVSQENQEKTA